MSPCPGATEFPWHQALLQRRGGLQGHLGEHPTLRLSSGSCIQAPHWAPRWVWRAHSRKDVSPAHRCPRLGGTNRGLAAPTTCRRQDPARRSPQRDGNRAENTDATPPGQQIARLGKDKGHEPTSPPKQHPWGQQHTRHSPARGVWETPSSRTGRGHLTLSRTAPFSKTPSRVSSARSAETETPARWARAEEGAAAAADNRTALLARGKQFQEAAALLPRSAPRGGSGVPGARPHACAQDCAFIKS